MPTRERAIVNANDAVDIARRLLEARRSALVERLVGLDVDAITAVLAEDAEIVQERFVAELKNVLSGGQK